MGSTAIETSSLSWLPIPPPWSPSSIRRLLIWEIQGRCGWHPTRLAQRPSGTDTRALACFRRPRSTSRNWRTPLHTCRSCGGKVRRTEHPRSLSRFRQWTLVIIVRRLEWSPRCMAPSSISRALGFLPCIKRCVRPWIMRRTPSRSISISMSVMCGPLHCTEQAACVAACLYSIRERQCTCLWLLIAWVECWICLVSHWTADLNLRAVSFEIFWPNRRRCTKRNPRAEFLRRASRWWICSFRLSEEARLDYLAVPELERPYSSRSSCTPLSRCIAECRCLQEWVNGSGRAMNSGMRCRKPGSCLKRWWSSVRWTNPPACDSGLGWRRWRMQNISEIRFSGTCCSSWTTCFASCRPAVKSRVYWDGCRQP